MGSRSALILVLVLFVAAACGDKKVKKIGKDVRDMTDADLEQLLDQWEVGIYVLLQRCLLLSLFEFEIGSKVYVKNVTYIEGNAEII